MRKAPCHVLTWFSRIEYRYTRYSRDIEEPFAQYQSQREIGLNCVKFSPDISKHNFTIYTKHLSSPSVGLKWPERFLVCKLLSS